VIGVGSGRDLGGKAHGPQKLAFVAVRRIPTVLMAGMLLLGGACGDDEDSAADALAARIQDEAPADFRAANDDDGFPQGAFDLEGFLETYSTNEDDDRDLLEGHGFEGGYARTWIAEPSGTVATVIGFQFEDDEGARDVGEAFNSEALEDEGAAEFEVRGLPGATGIRGTQEGEDGTQYIHTVTLAIGRQLFTAAVVSANEADESELAMTLARRQASVPEDDGS
jgi:hypothetical protein